MRNGKQVIRWRKCERGTCLGEMVVEKQGAFVPTLLAFVANACSSPVAIVAFIDGLSCLNSVGLCRLHDWFGLPSCFQLLGNQNGVGDLSASLCVCKWCKNLNHELKVSLEFYFCWNLGAWRQERFTVYPLYDHHRLWTTAVQGDYRLRYEEESWDFCSKLTRHSTAITVWVHAD